MKGRRDLGSVTVEATIALTIFIFAFLGVSSLSSLARAESKVQYALNQSAKELSQYMYIFYRAGLYEQSNAGNEGVKEVDELIKATGDFSEMIKTASTDASSVSEIFNKDDVANEIGTTIESLKEDATGIVEKGKALGEKYKAVADNPTAVLNGIYDVIKDSIGSTIRSKIVAPIVGNVLMPKYLESNNRSADEYLEGVGVENGMSGLNFALSSIMEDGRTINLTVVYTVKYRIPLIGEKDFVIKQTASTAAWSMEKGLDEVKASIWDKSPLKRGQEIVENIKNQNSAFAVDTDKTHGFDLYDKNTNTFTQIISINTGDPSYISSAEGGKVVLNETNFKKKLKSEMNSLSSAIEDVDVVNMENGNQQNVSNDKRNGVLQIYIPKDSDLLKSAQAYADEVAKDYPGIKIKVSYYEE